MEARPSNWSAGFGVIIIANTEWTTRLTCFKPKTSEDEAVQ